MSDNLDSIGKAHINIVASNDRALAYLSGRIDIDSSPTVGDGLLGMLQPPSAKIVTVDLTGVTVYRATPEQIGFYEYHRWVADPRLLVTNAVVDHLRASGHFSSVSRYDGNGEMDYIFSGNLENWKKLTMTKA